MDLGELKITLVQKRILELFAMGYNPVTIGRRLHRAPSTISTTLTRIKTKIGMEHATFEDFRVAMISRKRAVDLEYDNICGVGGAQAKGPDNGV